jgi:hypothetical protein
MGDHGRCRSRTVRRPPTRRCAEQASVVQAYLEAIDAGDDPTTVEVLTPQGRCTLEEAFVAVCAEYTSRRRISSEAWEAMGVPLDVLAAARISPRSDPPPTGWRSW